MNVPKKKLALTVLLPLLLVGAAFAAYQVWSYTFTTDVLEPITVTVTKELTNPMYPGLGTNSEYEIHNSGGAGLSVTVTWPASNPDNAIAIYATIRYIDSEGNSLDDIVRVDYDGTETFTLYSDGYAPTGKSSYARVQVGVLVSADAPPGTVNVPVTVSRG